MTQLLRENPDPKTLIRQQEGDRSYFYPGLLVWKLFAKGCHKLHEPWAEPGEEPGGQGRFTAPALQPIGATSPAAAGDTC